MYCSRCGVPLPEGSAFCPQCGARVAIPAQKVYSSEGVPAQDAVPSEDVPAQDAVPSEDVPAQDAAPSEEVSVFDDFNAADEPIAPNAFSADEGTTYAAAPEVVPPVKKRNCKRLVISLIAAVLALVLVAGGLVYALVLRKPEVQLAWALNNTKEEFGELWGHCENLNEFVECSKALAKADKKTLELGVSSDTDGQAISYHLRVDGDPKHKQAGGAFGLESDGLIPKIEVRYYLDTEKLVFTLPDLVKDAYSIPTKDFGKKLLDSHLGELLDLERTEKLEELSLDPFGAGTTETDFSFLTDLLIIEKTDRQIPDISSKMTVYRVTMDWDTYAQRMQESDLSNNALWLFMSSAYGVGDIDSAIEEIKESGIQLLVGVNDDHCASVFCLYNEKEDSAITLLLCGKDNLWSNIELIVDGKTVMTGYCARTENGFRVELRANGESLLIECDDKRGELSLGVSEEALLLIEYAAADGGVEFNTDFYVDGESLSLTMRLLPLETIDPLSDDPIDIFSMSKTKLQFLVMEIYSNLQSAIQ